MLTAESKADLAACGGGPGAAVTDVMLADDVGIWLEA